MAGAGAKLFASGDVLTADQVNTYLMDQTIMKFASTSARDAAFGAGKPTLAEGMFAYTTDTNTLWLYTGSAWQNVLGSSIGELQLGNRNKIINGAFNVWQRGTSFSSMGFTAYTADRFANAQLNTLAVTASQQSFTPGAAPVAGYESAFFHRTVIPTNSAAGDYALVQQKIEDVRSLPSGSATISFWAKATSGTPKIAVELTQNFGSGGSPSTAVDTYVGQVTLSTSWARYSLTVTVPSISGKTIGTTDATSHVIVSLWYTAGSTFNSRTGSLGNQANTFDLWGVQVEAGSVATPFETEDIGTTLAKCQRYYTRFTASTSGAYAVFAVAGMTESTTTGVGYTPLPVELRSYPSSVEYGGTIRVVPTGTEQTVTAISLQDRTNTKVLSITYTVASGLTANQYMSVRANNSSTAYLGVSAEL